MPGNANRPKVVFLLVAADAVGGTEIAAKRQAAALSSRFDVELVSVFRIGSHGNGMTAGDVAVTYLLGDDARNPRYGSMLADLNGDQRMREQADLVLADYLASIKSDADVVALMSMSPLFLRPLSLFYRGRSKIFHQEHRRTETRTRSLQEILIFGHICDGIFVLTERTRTALTDYMGPGGPEIRVIRNGIDRSRIRPLPGRPRVVLASRLTAEKQCDEAIAAFSEVLTQVPDAELLVCGDGPERAGLETIVQEMGLLESVRFLGTVDMEAVWPTTSVGLLSSKTEAMPMVVLEANAHGVPYILYDSGDGVRELIDQNQTGIIVQQGDVSGLAQAVAALLSSTDKLATFSQSAFGKVARYGIADTTSELIGLMQSVPARSLKRKRQAIRKRLSSLPSAFSYRSPRAETEIKEARDRLGTLGYRIIGKRAHLPAEGRLPIDARNENANLVMEAARAAAATCIVQPRADWTKLVVLVEKSRRKAFLERLRAQCERLPVYVEPLFENDNRGPAEHISSFKSEHPYRAVPAYRIYGSYADPEGSVRYAGEYSTIVRFADFRDDGSVVAHTRQGEEVMYSEPASFHDPWLGDLPTLAQLRDALPDLHLAPVVDAIYILPDGADLQAGKVRLADDWLRYSVRSLRYFAPWIRTIFLLRESPLPAWLSPQPGSVEIVRPDELFGSSCQASAGNPNAVEARIPSIPGLAGHFLLLDSGTILNSAASVEAFYGLRGAHILKSGSLLQKRAKVDAGLGSRIYTAKCIRREVGYAYYDEYDDAVRAFERPVLDELQDRYADEIAATVQGRGRGESDFLLLTTGYQEYSRATGRAHLSTSKVYRHSLRHGTVARLNDELTGRASEIISVSDDAEEHGGAAFAHYRVVLERKFSTRSDCEIAADGGSEGAPERHRSLAGMPSSQ